MPGAVAQLRHVDLLLLPAQARRAALRAIGGRSAELLANNAQRQELVALQAQDRDQALDVCLGEQAVAAACAPRLQQALILEVADLRDRDVGELVPQALAHRADRMQAGRRARFGKCRHRRRNVILYLPIWTSSSSSRTLLSIRRLLTNVPLRLPRSRIVNTFPSRVSSA